MKHTPTSACVSGKCDACQSNDTATKSDAKSRGQLSKTEISWIEDIKRISENKSGNFFYYYAIAKAALDLNYALFEVSSRYTQSEDRAAKAEDRAAKAEDRAAKAEDRAAKAELELNILKDPSDGRCMEISVLRQAYADLRYRVKIIEQDREGYRASWENALSQREEAIQRAYHLSEQVQSLLGFIRELGRMKDSSDGSVWAQTIVDRALRVVATQGGT